jgi:hypothetical protein
MVRVNIALPCLLLLEDGRCAPARESASCRCFGTSLARVPPSYLLRGCPLSLESGLLGHCIPSLGAPVSSTV